MKPRRVLVVDDEPVNLQIIGECLEEPEFALQPFANAEQAWQELQGATALPDLMILDRMMPGMDGIELLRRVKAEPRLRHIPVIIQTAAANAAQVREGIEAGAYYYLTKPYTPELLLAIVRAVLADIEQREAAFHLAASHVQALRLLERAEFHFRLVAEIDPLVELLSNLCPDPAAAAIALGELLMNAVEHGNLGISYQEKKRLRIANAWDAEVARRQAMPQYAARWASVTVERLPDRIEFTIRDQGAGFDWRPYLDFVAERAADPNGRGIAMARNLCFSDIEFRGNGNTVVARLPLLPVASKL